MMDKYEEILLKNWGYDSFRSPQKEIIESVAAGKDTLGLMPTGGGKSITFQVFSLSKPGVCLVVTPLIALMKDQVENLAKRRIKAVAIYSGMTAHEIEVAINNVCFGDYKFLYLSPERLQNEYFKGRLPDMPVNLITVDEAHCISQWGYDFRPPYLQIAEIRKQLPDIPVLALTATATPEVVKDIQDKLNFPEYNVMQKSFERKNLVYYVVNTEDKEKRLLYLLQKVPGTAVVYVRNRRKTREYADFLSKNGYSADYYHAGLDSAIRSDKQMAWQNNKIRIMVCTNAFGMGIDKPDVRLVVHLDLPDSLEAYFQEAGRAGRDGQKAWAFLLFNKSDVIQSKKNITVSFPKNDVIVDVYNAICNYLQIAVGDGANKDFIFDAFDFAKKFHFDVLTTFNSIKILETNGLLTYSDDTDTRSRVLFLVNRDDLYRFQVENARLDDFIKLLLRTYTGLFNDYIYISEDFLATKIGCSVALVVDFLKKLRHEHIINYVPRTNKPMITLLAGRMSERGIYLDHSKLKEQKKRVVTRMNAMLTYATNNNKCRSQFLLAYFGETDTYRCGNCDVCINRNELGLSKYEFDTLLAKIKATVASADLSPTELIDSLQLLFDVEKVKKILRWLLDHEKIFIDKSNCVRWKS